MRVDVLTLFPEMLEGAISASMIRIAREKGLLEVFLHDFRRFAGNRWGKVDDRPYGGGPGMVLCCEPIYAALEDLFGRALGPGEPPLGGEAEPGTRVFLLSPQGRRLDQRLLEELAGSSRIVLVCGHYEGFDERVRAGLQLEELSIGDYVLSGGEPAALVVIDGVARLLEGALGHAESTREESFSEIGLEYPQYTRPPVYRGMGVPEVLVSGHHGEIRRWRLDEARRRTSERRPDLLAAERTAADEQDGSAHAREP